MRTPEREKAYLAVDSECDYQDSLWGNTGSSDKPGNGERSIDEFALYISAYTNKMVDQCGTYADPVAKLETIRKVATLAIRAMEQHGAPLRVAPSEIRTVRTV